jgi:high-affinity Fe2+/Pb2+ permease
VLADDRGIGSFLAGLVGYRARPSALEVAAYLAYLVVAAVLLTRGTSPARRAGRERLRVAAPAVSSRPAEPRALRRDVR